MDYNTLKSAIPRYMCERVRSMSENQCFTDNLFRRYMEADKVSKFVYREIQEKNAASNLCDVQKKWESELNEPISLGEETLRLKKCTDIMKYRSFQYRFLHRAIVTNEQLYRWGIKASNNCTFCEVKRESVRHLFYDCEQVKPLWCNAMDICQDIGLECPDELSYSSVVRNHWSEKHDSASNLICLITKQYIYRQRCLGKELKIQELTSSIYNVKNIEKYYAVKDFKLKKFYIRWNCPFERMPDELSVVEYLEQMNNTPV